jgi:hypothetical protein
MRKTNTLLAGSIALVGAVALLTPSAMAATATPTASPKPTVMASATAKPTASASTGALIGGSPSTWTPVTVLKKDKGSTIKLVKDQAFIFHGFVAKVKFKSSNTKVVVVSNAEGKGTYTASAGGRAVATGTAKITATNGKIVVATYTVEVK